LTCIEFGVFVPLVLFAMGYDQQGSLGTMLALTLAVLSQIPKRLIKRLRPWQAGRAVKRRSDRTSSFPSRAVAGAVVYAFFACAAPTMSSDGVIRVSGWIVPVMLAAAALAAFARIQLGCHYFSDCVVGALLGVVSIALGAGLYAANMSTCSAACYAAVGSGRELTLATLGRANWVVLGVGSLISLVLVGSSLFVCVA
jgi:membrane-associated phospholipid phosphatase